MAKKSGKTKKTKENKGEGDASKPGGFDIEVYKAGKDISKGLGASVVVEDDLRSGQDVKLPGKDVRAERRFYRKFVLKCLKCMSEFEHELEAKAASAELKCPSCGGVHSVEFTDSGDIIFKTTPSVRLLSRR